LRKPSVTGEFPIPQPPRPSAVRISEAHLDKRASDRSESMAVRGRSSPAPSSHSRLSRYMPRMELFRDVMRDELCYTTFITASCVVVAVLALIGVNFRNGLTVSKWLSLNWAVISVLAIHSFGRVIRRHERDAILQEPQSWQAPRTPLEHRRNPRQQSSPPISTRTSHRRVWRKASDLEDKSNPYSETRGLKQPRTSWNSYSASFYGSDISSPKEEKSWSPTVPLPSLLVEEFPSSGRTTPLVAHDSADATLIQGFRHSWLNEQPSSTSPGFSTLIDDKSTNRGSIS